MGHDLVEHEPPAFGPELPDARIVVDHLFRAVAAVHPRHRTPYVAVSLIGGSAIVYLFVNTIEGLVATLILGMWPFLAMAVAAVILQRRRRPALERPFRVPLYPLPPLFFLLACAGIFANSLREQPRFTLTNFAVLAAGLPIYWLWRRRMPLPAPSPSDTPPVATAEGVP